MGFYGNVTNTSKTTFSFDIKYNTRVSMDRQVETDGVFLGRYVLIDYDESPVKAYYNKENDRFYNTANFSLSSQITPRSDIIYQDLHNAMDGLSFYEWDASQSRHVLIQSGTPYQEHFSTDVKEYGRGYDSTVWVKQYDTINDKYKYVMIAELNAVVPTLHMVVNQPNAIPVTPYFDRDTTNIDYYLHMQSDFGTRVKKADQEIKSDEEATRIMARWIQDESGYQTYEEYTETVPADIYYNDKGFDHIKRTFMEDKITYQLIDDNGEIIDNAPLKEIDYSKNSIGYDMGQSGRKYGIDADLGVYTNGVQADDVYDWYFRLPGIGNAICKMWDKVYDDRGNNQIRALNKSQMKNDTSDHLVSYNKETLIGMMNTTQDLLGYHFIPTNDTYKNGYTTTEKDATINVNLTYNTFEENNPILSGSVQYKLLNCLFYDKPVQDNEAVTKYYHFAYTPTYDQVTGTTLQKDKQYYHFVDGIWEIANPAIYGQTDADGNPILDKDSNQTLSIGNYYTRNDKWTLMPITADIGDNIYSLINLIHSIIGTNADDVRSLDTMKGTINCIKDIIANIDLDLSPGKLLHTNNQGVIETTNTYFPSATWDEDKVLDGAGRWVSRFATVKILKNSIEDNQKNPEVNIITNGVEQNVVTIIESDNDKTESGNSLKHTTNNLTLGSRNKWIELYGNADKDSIEFKHSQSPIVSRLRAEQAEGSSYVDMFEGVDENENVILKDSTSFQNFSVNGKATEIKVEPTTDNLNYKNSDSDRNDNRLTIPYITVDNAGHVVELGTKNFNIPNNFKKIATATIDDSNESDSRDQAGISIAETINDTLNFAPRNRWINIATETTNDEEGKQEDTITWSHRLTPVHNENITLNGSRRTLESEIPTVYRYGLPQDKSITDLDEDFGGYDTSNNKIVDPELIKEKANTFNVPYIEIDKAGHVVAAATHTVELPHTYNKISTGAVINDEALEGTAGHTIDTLAKEVTGIKAETLSEEIQFASSNKWIRIDAIGDTKKDIVKFGHEIHTIDTTSKHTTDLDKTSDKNIITQSIEYDDAGHIISKHTETWNLPYSLRNIHVTTAEALDSIENNSEIANIQATQISDTFKFSPANNWIRLQTNNTNNNHEILFGHLTQGTANTYGTDLKFAEFGGQVTLYGYQTDDAGHVIGYPTYTLTLPKGSCTEDEDNDANVLTSLSFNSATGALHGYKTNIGNLLLTGYTTENITSAAIVATDTLNIAIAKLQQQIDTETAARTADVANLQSQINTEVQNRTEKDNDLQSQLNAEIQNRTEKDNNLQSQLDKINWLANYIDFEALYTTVSARLESEYGISKLPIEEG